MDSIQLNKLLFERLKKIESKHPEQKILIFLDSLDQLNKLDFNLNWFLKEYPGNTKVVYSTLQNHGEISETLKRKGIEDECFMKIRRLDFETAIKMFNNSMVTENRELANEAQKKVVEELFKNKSTELYPLFVKLVFDISKRWYSFTPIPDEFPELNTINKVIEYIFKTIEEDYGELLVSRCLFYLTLANDESGISDCEMEDVLSLDTELLSHLFKIQKSPIKRFPITLWNRIKLHLQEYITVNEFDETQVNCW